MGSGIHIQQMGSGPRLFILHGLFGEGSNWRGIAAKLSQDYTVCLVDLPNHGLSIAGDKLTRYPQMEKHIVEAISELGDGPSHIVGHSMGGKLGMYIALHHPELCRSLTVVDIAPKIYPPFHQKLIVGMQEIIAKNISQRKEADALLAEYEKNEEVRLFILRSLESKENGDAQWRFNFDAINKDYGFIRSWMNTEASFRGDVCFICGGKSHYVDDEDRILIRYYFPHMDLVWINQSGHWVHVEARKEFLGILRNFLFSVSR